MAYIVSPFAGLGGGISWRPPAYRLLLSQRGHVFIDVSLFVNRNMLKNCTTDFHKKNGGNAAYLPRMKPLNFGGNPNDITLGSGSSRVRLTVRCGQVTGYVLPGDV